MPELLAGQVAVVTGAGRGIGLGIAQRYAEEGAAVVLADVALDAVEHEAQRITAATGARTLALHVDVTDEESLQQACRRTRDEIGGATVVVANAGILHLAPVVDLARRDWQRVLDVNLTGAFLTCQVFARDLLDRTAEGRILLTSSLFGRRGGVENAAYSATKFGVLGLMQCLAAELAPHGILVNAVCPGQIGTEMIDQLLADRARLTGVGEDELRARMLSRVVTGRLGTVEEVADAFVYLASPLSRYVTGQALVVDGGYEVG